MLFREFLRNKRIKRGLSIQDLAALNSMHPSYISQIENGHKNPRISNALKIVKSLGVNVGELKCIKENFIYHGAIKDKVNGKKTN